jgi:hypothetical protein
MRDSAGACQRARGFAKGRVDPPVASGGDGRDLHRLFHEKDRKWSRAEGMFQELMEIVPDPDNLVFKNAAEHLKLVRREMRKG